MNFKTGRCQSDRCRRLLAASNPLAQDWRSLWALRQISGRYTLWTLRPKFSKNGGNCFYNQRLSYATPISQMVFR